MGHKQKMLLKDGRNAKLNVVFILESFFFFTVLYMGPQENCTNARLKESTYVLYNEGINIFFAIVLFYEDLLKCFLFVKF